MAVKAGVAASLSWLAALQVPGRASEYAFYAPLGAVVASYPTVRASTRESFQGVASIALGAALAVVADRYLGASPVLIAVVVALAVLLGGLPWLGAMRSYVPTAALFVLVIGQGEEVTYSLSFAGLFLLGAGIAIGLNLLSPGFPLGPADHTLARLREALHEHLDHLARSFAGERDIDDAAAPGRSGLTALTTRAREAAIAVRESVAGNRRARRMPGAADRRYEAFRALERVVLLVDDVYDLADEQPWGRTLASSSHQLRAPIARALDELSELVLEVGTDGSDGSRRSATDAAVADLTETLAEHRAEGGDQAEALVASTIVTNLRRCLAAVSPAEELSTIPGPRREPTAGPAGGQAD